MPTLPLRPCAGNCGARVTRGRCTDCSSKAERQRGSAHARGYDSRWRERSKAFLRRYPLCGDRPDGRMAVGSLCRDAGRLTRATLTDHVIPHKGNERLFWDERGNWQALCSSCHSVKTAREDGGFGR